MLGLIPVLFLIFIQWVSTTKNSFVEKETSFKWPSYKEQFAISFHFYFITHVPHN